MPRAPKQSRSEQVIRQAAGFMSGMFPEPDHTPELEIQSVYAGVRENVYTGVDDEPPTAQRVKVAPDSYIDTRPHTGPRSACTWPSHQRWFVEAYPHMRSRDDQHV